MNLVKRRSKRSVLVGVGSGALAVTLLLTGCAGIRGTVPDAAIVPQADCDEPGTAGRIPDGFEPTMAILCNDLGTVTDDDGVWTGPATRHLDGDLAPLIDALNQADDPRWLGPCTTHMVIIPQLWLVDAADRAVRVTHPVDGCGQPKTDAVNAALGRLTVTASSIDRQELIDSKGAIEAGCSTQWTPLRLTGPGEFPQVPELDTFEPLAPVDAEPGEIATIPFGLPPVDQIDGMLLCRYAADANLDPPTDPTDMVGLPFLGTFTSGSTLNAEDGRTVLAAASYEVMPLIGCIRPATAFVVAHPLVDGEGTGGTITIELDDCQRLFGTSGFTLVSDDILELVQPR